MPRKVRVLTTSTYGPDGRTVSDFRDLACAFVDAAGAERADLVCLPENFLDQGVPREQRPVVESIPGPTFDAVATLARKHGVWVVLPFCVGTETGQIENSAVVIDRQGQLAGRYAKVYPTIGECEDRHVTPGGGVTVIDTDFGRLGLAICYDIGWPQHWARLKEAGAEMVVWPSAYDGGFPLQAYAWSHFYYVVSAVRSEHSRIIDLTGRVLASTSRWHRLAAETIDLEKEVFHIDHQVEKMFRIQRELGQRVGLEALSEENVFTLESHDPAWSVGRIKDAFGLENFRDYHARAECIQDRHRGHVLAVGSAGADD